MNTPPLLSIIIPLKSQENLYSRLLENLQDLKVNYEIIIVIPDQLKDFQLDQDFKNLHISTAQVGRASQMNAGAKQAKGEFLWFLHADSYLPDIQLVNFSDLSSNALYYFQLKFLTDGPVFCCLNAFFAGLRSSFLRLPFGDQGFLLSKDLFNELNGYQVQCHSGEDLELVQHLKSNHNKIIALNHIIYTSARKYQNEGWLSTTLKHLVFTFKFYLKNNYA